MNVTDVSWSRDHHGRPVLELKIGGRSAYIRSRQQTEMTQRGILQGIVFLDSERGAQLPNIYLQGDYSPAYGERDLIGCTDNPQVFALYQEMCQAIRTDHWHEGLRPAST